LKWALGRPGRLRAAAVSALRGLDGALAEEPIAPRDVTADLRRHGVLDSAEKLAIRRDVARELIAPCTRALLLAGCDDAAQAAIGVA
jgi:hypothetical protein